MKVCIQAGHQNIQNNVDPGLRLGTGAPGEVDFTIDVANKVSSLLRQKGIEVQQTDANANSDPTITKTDWNLFLAIHYEADIHNTNGYFVAAPDPSADAVNGESVRIANAINTEYAKLGIPNHPEWQNPNTKFYYMWSALSAKTPCVLIECGVGWRVPEDHNFFTNHRDRVIEQIGRGVCSALNIPFDPPAPPPVDVTIQLKKDLDSANQRVALLTNQVSDLKAKITILNNIIIAVQNEIKNFLPL